MTLVPDARIALDELLSGRTEESTVDSVRPPERSALSRWLSWAVAARVAFGAVAVAVGHLRGPSAEPVRTIRFQVSPPPSPNALRRGRGFELSPDGA